MELEAFGKHLVEISNSHMINDEYRFHDLQLNSQEGKKRFHKIFGHGIPRNCEIGYELLDADGFIEKFVLINYYQLGGEVDDLSKNTFMQRDMDSLIILHSNEVEITPELAKICINKYANFILGLDISIEDKIEFARKIENHEIIIDDSQNKLYIHGNELPMLTNLASKYKIKTISYQVHVYKQQDNVFKYSLEIDLNEPFTGNRI